MNAPLLHTVFDLDRSYFSVIIPGDDGFTVTTESEAHHRYRSLFSGFVETQASDAGTIARTKRGIVVIESNPIEGWSRDVTRDFAEWGEDRDEPDPDFCLNTGVYPRASGWRK